MSASGHTAGVPAEIAVGPGWGWIEVVAGEAAVRFKGYLTEGERTFEGAEAAIRAGRAIADAADDTALERALAKLTGHFALIVETPQRVVTTVDRIRSVPLMWGEKDGVVRIDDRGRRLRDRLGLSHADHDADTVLAVAMSGYAVGGRTLYRGLRQLRAGEALVVDRDHPRTLRWFVYDAWRTAPLDWPERRLSDLHRFMIERLATSAGGRPICVPLSAGLDSRMIAAGLKAVGYRNVKLFAYGRPGNHEAETSRAIAGRLGYPWAFVPYTVRSQRALFDDPDHERMIWQEADTCGGVPFEQDWIAIAALKKSGFIAPDALIVNGQSGDFITGNHVPKALLGPERVSDARRAVYDAFLAKHHGMWSTLSTAPNRAQIEALLDAEVAAAGTAFGGDAEPHGIYEFLEYQDRQVKYVVSGQRTYEAMDLGWRLPLWDDEFIAFWQHVPLDLKARQNLYRRVLESDDWGGVFRDVPVNAKTIRPRWLVPLRLTARAALAPLGRERWHRAERRLFEWWMDPLRLSGYMPYLRAVADNRGPRHAVSWLIERYLAAHGVSVNALIHRAAA